VWPLGLVRHSPNYARVKSAQVWDKTTTSFLSLGYYYRHKCSVGERREREKLMTQEQSIATGRLALDDATVQAFEADLRGDVLHPTDEGYDQARPIHNGMIDRRPTLIARWLISWVRRVWEALRPFTSGGVYINYQMGDEAGDRLRAAYGPDRYERLAALKKEYDPDNLFRLNQNISPTASLS
jgi:hypothetical protein